MPNQRIATHAPRARGAWTLRLACRILACRLLIVGGQLTPAAGPEYKGLICRGVEESGRVFIGQPGFLPHLISLFTTGPDPLSASRTLPDHVAWVNNPLHSYVADGTGGLCVWAHPGPRDAPHMLNLPGLAGMELQHGGAPVRRDALWDQVLLGCVAAGRPFLWGYAADDTHSRTRIGLSWYAARVARLDESALKTALRAGALYVSNGPAIADVAVSNRTITLKLEQECEVLWLRAGQHLGAEPAAGIAVTKDLGENRCLKRDQSVRTASLDVTELGLAPDELKFVRAIVRTDPTHIAQTQPWRVTKDGLDNPYPPAGIWVRGQTHNHTDTAPEAPTKLTEFRLAYQAKGMLGSFSTDYSYWESPYQWLPDDGTPQVQSVTPDRCRAGERVEALVKGVNLSPEAVVQVGMRAVRVLNHAAEGLRIEIPGDLAPGRHDLCVTNPNRFRGTLAQGFIVRNADADTRGWRWFTVADGLPYPRATCVTCVGDDVWVGTISGAARWHAGAWEHHKRLPARSAYAMAPDAAGGLWISCAGGMAFCGPDGKWSSQAVGDSEKLGNKHGAERWGRMALDAAGSLWVVNRWNRGLAVRRNGEWRRLTTKDGAPGNSPCAVTCDAAGAVWVAFNSGIHKLSGEKWTRLDLPDALDGCQFTSALASAPDGAVWAAVTSSYRPEVGGVVRFRGEEIAVYTPANSPLPSTRIRDILVSRTGQVWFVSDVGAARLGTAGEWNVVTALNSGLGCDIILGLAEDRQGRIWFATARGVACFAPGQDGR